MKKNIYFLAGMLSFGALFTGCDDDDFGKAVSYTHLTLPTNSRV